MGQGRSEAGHGKGQGVVSGRVGAVWVRMYGGRKQEEGEVAIASSPSYKCGAGVTALAITPALF